MRQVIVSYLVWNFVTSIPQQSSLHQATQHSFFESHTCGVLVIFLWTDTNWVCMLWTMIYNDLTKLKHQSNEKVMMIKSRSPNSILGVATLFLCISAVLGRLHVSPSVVNNSNANQQRLRKLPPQDQCSHCRDSTTRTCLRVAGNTYDCIPYTCTGTHNA